MSLIYLLHLEQGSRLEYYTVIVDNREKLWQIISRMNKDKGGWNVTGYTLIS